MTGRATLDGYRRHLPSFIDTRPVFNAVVKHAQAIILKDPLGKAESLLTLSIGTRLVIEDGGNDDYHKTTLIDGRRGWIKKGDVNIPAPAMDIASLRKKILETTKLFLGMPYLWGGRSAYCAEWGSGFRDQGQGSNVQKEEGRWEREADASGPIHNLEPRTFNPPPRHRRTGFELSQALLPALIVQVSLTLPTG